MIDHLRQTQEAFDSVAADYDGPKGNNELIQDMRGEMWRWLDASFPGACRLLDIGCGTGLDAVRMAIFGHRITATDWSNQMTLRTADRARRECVSERVQALPIGAQDLSQLEEAGQYAGAYSNLGPLNCVPDLRAVSRECFRLLKPGGRLVFTVIGRLCPWEVTHYALQGRWARVRVRFAGKFVPVGMNQRTIWTHYYYPREFYEYFREHFALLQYRGMCLFAPPPYLSSIRTRQPRLYERLWRIDRRLAGWPMLRNLGDHFLIVMQRRE